MRMELRAHGRVPAGFITPAKPVVIVWALAAALTLSLAGCGETYGGGGTFEKSSDDCSTSVASHRYLVSLNDGGTELVRASSDEEFETNYMKTNQSRVRFAEPDYWVRTDADSGWYSRKPARAADNWGAVRVGADALWSRGFRGDGVTVAVIDTGMDPTHPQLINRLAINPGETGLDSLGRDKATNGIDDDGNGAIDDVNGYDFLRGRPLVADNSHHGTHVSGIIAAEHTDQMAGPGDHVEGIAPGARLLPLAFLDQKGLGLMSDAVKALRYAVQRGARVVNASWGGSQCSRSLREAIRDLSARDVAFVTASGNESINVDRIGEFPATLNLPPMLTIGATDAYDLMTVFSNFGTVATHVFAPGQDIVSTLPGNQMGALSGTSMATPFAAGAVALLLSAEPTATVAQIREAIYASSSYNANYLNASRGRLDLRTALAELRRIVAGR